MMKLLTRSFFLVALQFYSVVVCAQSIINTEKLYSNDSSKINIIFEPGADIQRGNTNVTEVFGTLNLIYRPTKKFTVKVLGGGDVLLESGRRILDDQFAQGRLVQSFGKKVELFEFAQWQSSLNLLLNNRQVYGGGLRFKLFHQDSNAIFMDYSIGAFKEIERLDGNIVLNNQLYQNKLNTSVTRLSTFVVFKVDLSPKLSFVNTTYSQPIVARFNDYRVFNEADLAFNVFSWLSFSVNFTYRFDSKQPDVLSSSDFFFNLGAVLHAHK